MLISSSLVPSETSQRLRDAGFAIFGLSLWTVFVLGLDTVVASRTLTLVAAQSYPSVAGVIDQGETLRFRYSVDGRDYVGRRRQFLGLKDLPRWSSPKPHLADGADGVPITVYYNPADPQDSALDRTFTGLPLALALLLAPLNLLLVGGWSWLVCRVRGIHSLPLRREADRWVVLPTNGRPVMVALIIGEIASIAAIFVAGAGGWWQSLPFMLTTWTALLTLIGLAFWHTRSLVRREPPLLILDNASMTVTWPGSDAAPKFSVSRTQLLGAEMDVSRPSPSAPPAAERFAILLRFTGDDGQPTRRLVRDTDRAAEAGALAAWLDAWIRGSAMSLSGRSP